MPRISIQLPLFHPAPALRLVVAACVLVFVMAGCARNKATVSDLKYPHETDRLNYYRDYETRIEYPCVDTQTTEVVANSLQPRNIMRRADDASRGMSLDEAVFLALSHNKVIETSALGGVGSKAVLTNPDTVLSVYDPAIQRTGVLFGRGRGVEAALADFDTTFSTSAVWGRSLAATGNAAPIGAETGTFTSSLSKQFATGASLQLNNDWNYVGTGIAPPGGFPSAFSGRIGAAYRHPLLAGGGVEYTRIAGPVTPGFGAITGVGQGVLIARISSDITLADFEIAVRNAVQDIENAYWDLYLAYRTYDTAVIAHQSAFQTWRESQDRLEVGVLKPADELQTRDRLYETKATVETTLSQLFRAESELRRLAGLPTNDGTVIRPVDEPVLAEYIPDWHASLKDGLTHRVELRRQKWNIKSAQLQLQAARSLVRPQLDFVGSYDFNAFGDQLVTQGNGQFRSALGSLASDDLESWTAGVELSIPIGFRLARSQVRNLELQLAKATAVLAAQEKNIAHDIATSIQDVTASYAAAQSNYKRMKAASRRVELLEAERDVGTLTLDLVLRAQASLAAAESAYFEQLVQYAKALTTMQLSTGRLLEHHGVHLDEGPWTHAARSDAAVRAHKRTNAVDALRLRSAPGEFASPGPTGAVELNVFKPASHSKLVPLPTARENDVEGAPPQPSSAGDHVYDEPIPLPDLSAGTDHSAAKSSIASAADLPASTGGASQKRHPAETGAVKLLDTLVPERRHLYDRDPPQSASADVPDRNPRSRN